MNRAERRALDKDIRRGTGRFVSTTRPCTDSAVKALSLLAWAAFEGMTRGEPQAVENWAAVARRVGFVEDMVRTGMLRKSDAEPELSDASRALSQALAARNAGAGFTLDDHGAQAVRKVLGMHDQALETLSERDYLAAQKSADLFEAKVERAMKAGKVRVAE